MRCEREGPPYRFGLDERRREELLLLEGRPMVAYWRRHPMKPRFNYKDYTRKQLLWNGVLIQPCASSHALCSPALCSV